MTHKIKSHLKIKEVEKYVRQLLSDKLPTTLFYHDWNHTLNVKEIAIQLAKIEKVSKSDRELLSLAALFHGTGFINSYEGHEEESQVIAISYLRENGYPEDKINQVKNLIKVTNPVIAPVNLLEKIIVDADTAYVGQKKYRTIASNLRKEWELNKKDYNPTDLQWEEENLDYLQNKHCFHSNAGRMLFNVQKSNNIKKTEARLQKKQKKEATKLSEFSIAKNKGALTMFKTALRNHIDLTAIADQKSNIMLSVNALLLTIGTPIFTSYLSNQPYLLTPAIIFMLTCIVTIIFATLSTRPIKMDGQTNLNKISSGKTNLFFFGNFYNIDLIAYQDSVKQMIANKNQLDTSIINDLYFLGHSLGDKFRYLRICYNVFMIGISLSLVSFLIFYWLGIEYNS